MPSLRREDVETAAVKNEVKLSDESSGMAALLPVLYGLFLAPWLTMACRNPIGGAVFARMERSGEIEHPYFHAARITASLHPDFTVALTRALILGGAGNETVTPWRV